MNRSLFGFTLAAIMIVSSCQKTPDLDPMQPDLKKAQVEESDYKIIPDQYIVVLNDAELNAELSNLKGYEMRQQAAKKAAEKVMKRAGITDGELGLVYGTAIKGFSVKIPQGQLKKLEIDPAVVSVTEDKLITLIKPGTEEVSITSTQVIPWGITRVKGGTTYTGNNVAWIIDTGIDLDHPDLNVSNLGKTFVMRTSSPNDDNGHGTHVAGTIAAINNSIGVVGVAAGATVIPVKVLDRRGSGYMSWIIGGVDYVEEKGKSGDVANMSLGGSKYDLLNDAVKSAAAKGIKFSLAAGNESTHAGTRSPASAEGANIYTISAMAQGDLWASYSNYGNPPIDYCAPGSSIYSTYKDGGYATASGTSMAAPHVAGILLNGSIKTDGYVIGDPDKNPDRIGVVGGIQTTTGSITGKVTDGPNSIAGASIVVDNTNFSAISDNIGDYTISNIPTGNYSVTATASGFSSSTETNVSVLENKTTIVNFSLTKITSSGITLTATGYKIKGRQTVDLSWSGATSLVTIYRDNTQIATDVSSTNFTDNIGKLGGGTYVYMVCEYGTSTCSNTVTVTF